MCFCVYGSMSSHLMSCSSAYVYSYFYSCCYSHSSSHPHSYSYSYFYTYSFSYLYSYSNSTLIPIHVLLLICSNFNSHSYSYSYSYSFSATDWLQTETRSRYPSHHRTVFTVYSAAFGAVTSRTLKEFKTSLSNLLHVISFYLASSHLIQCTLI
jgi:hypothetical protein